MFSTNIFETHYLIFNSDKVLMSHYAAQVFGIILCLIRNIFSYILYTPCVFFVHTFRKFLQKRHFFNEFRNFVHINKLPKKPQKKAQVQNKRLQKRHRGCIFSYIPNVPVTERPNNKKYIWIT